MATLALFLAGSVFLLMVILVVVVTVRDNSVRTDKNTCKCGMTPKHKPKLAECRRVNEEAGRYVDGLGFVYSRDGSMYFDGVDWLPNPNYKPRLDAENFVPKPYGRGNDDGAGL